jgi:hypothetical protein
MEFRDKDILMIFRLGIETRLINYKSAIRWADKKINNSAIDAESYLFDLSLAGSKGINEVIHLLKTEETKTNLSDIWQTLYGLNNYLFTKGIIDLKCACYSISAIANEINNSSEYDLFGIGIDDAFYLGDVTELKKELSEYTFPYFQLGKEFFEEEIS